MHPKKILVSILRASVSLFVVAVAIVLILILWREYMLSPWTRDGRVSAEVVRLAPEVSGTIVTVYVVDNQLVKKDDVLYQIDPQRFQYDLERAQATVNARRSEKEWQASKARRRLKLNGVVANEDIEEAADSASTADAQYKNALADLAVAQLNLLRTTVRSPVGGYVTNVRLRSGDFATAATTNIAVIDANSFWITGYFEETKLNNIRVNDPAEVTLMAFTPKVRGHVESISRGIADSNDSPDHLGLPRVDPVFTWVRLAQRIPVRIHIDQVPADLELAAGMTCSVSVGAENLSRSPRGKLISWIRERL